MFKKPSCCCHENRDVEEMAEGLTCRAKKCPVCTRGKGFIVGNALALILWWAVKPASWLSVLLTLPMAADVTVKKAGKKKGLCEAGKFITGLLAGYAVLTLILKLISHLAAVIKGEE